MTSNLKFNIHRIDKSGLSNSLQDIQYILYCFPLKIILHQQTNQYFQNTNSNKEFEFSIHYTFQINLHINYINILCIIHYSHFLYILLYIQNIILDYNNICNYLYIYHIFHKYQILILKKIRTDMQCILIHHNISRIHNQIYFQFYKINNLQYSPSKKYMHFHLN